MKRAMVTHSPLILAVALAILTARPSTGQDASISVRRQLEEAFELRRKGEIEATAEMILKIARAAGDDDRGNVLGQAIIDLSRIPGRERETEAILSQIVGPKARLAVKAWVPLSAYQARIHMGDLAGAIEVLHSFLDEHPYRDHNSAYAYLDLVDCIAAGRGHKTAIPVAEELIRTYTSRSMNTYGRLANAKNVIALLEEYPGDGTIQTLKEYGGLFAKNRLYETAKVAYREASQKATVPAVAAEFLSRIGDMHDERDDDLRAAQWHAKAFWLGKRPAHGLTAVRLMARHASDFSEAEAIIREAATIAPESSDQEQMRHSIAYAYYRRKKDAPSALAHLAAMKGNLKSRRLEVECLMSQRDYAKALDCLRGMPRQLPHDGWCGFAAAECAAEYGKFIEEKTRKCTEALKLDNPDTPREPGTGSQPAAPGNAGQ